MFIQIKDFPDYSINERGEVFSVKQKKLLKPGRGNNEYLMVYLSNGTSIKACTVHRLVAETFIPNLDNKPIIDHIDGNRQNNCVENLRWVTYSENNRRSSFGGSIQLLNAPHHSKEKALSGHSKAVACYSLSEELLGSYPSASEAARHLGIKSISNIVKCANGRRKTCCDMIWKWID